MVKHSVRTKVSLVLVFCLSLATGIFWSMNSGEERFKDGVYQGLAQGYMGEIEIAITVAGGRINDINVVRHNETPGISDIAFSQVIPAILQAQSSEVDVATGATGTSNAIIVAFNQAALVAERDQ